MAQEPLRCVSTTMLIVHVSVSCAQVIPGSDGARKRVRHLDSTLSQYTMSVTDTDHFLVHQVQMRGQI